MGHDALQPTMHIPLEIPQLPFDLFCDILLRLPVRSLLRFKSVSKSCYNLIKSPSFIEKHLNYSKVNPNPVFNAVLSTVRCQEMYKDCFRVNLIDAFDKPIDLNQCFSCYIIEVLCLCDGLVCIIMHNHESDIVICNPLIEGFRRIPPPELQATNEHNAYSFFGLCLNADKGYELFRIVFEIVILHHEELEKSYVLCGEAYSMTTNTWRQFNVKRGDLKCLSYPHVSCFAHGSVPLFMHGVFYWQTGNRDREDIIVTFNVENEVFDQILLPFDWSPYDTVIRDLNKELAVVGYYENDPVFDIWVFNENEKDWKRTIRGKNIPTIDIDCNVFSVLGCVVSGELVINDRREYCRSAYNDRYSPRFFLYDTETNGLETLPYVNIGANYNLLFLYTESLVSV